MSRSLTFVLIALGTVTGLSGIDLVLPAIPELPAALGGDARTAQYVLAAFAGGTGAGLLLFGELGARYRLTAVLASSLFAYAALSLLAAMAPNLTQLVIARFFQGLAAAAPAVFAPVMIRRMYDDAESTAAIGRIGSIESLTPALAPVLGAWLLHVYDWRLSFYLTAAIAAALGCVWHFVVDRGFGHTERDPNSSYARLVRDTTFMRHALSQAFTLGALLIVVFAAPALMTGPLGGTLKDFIVMQMLGITFFILAATQAHRIVERISNWTTVVLGTLCTATGCLALLALGARAAPPVALVWALFVLVNLGLGVRGPPGFMNGLAAAGHDQTRGSALIIVLVMLTTAAGTGLAAPYVEQGLAPVAALASVVALAALALSVPRSDSAPAS